MGRGGDKCEKADRLSVEGSGTVDARGEGQFGNRKNVIVTEID